MWYLIENGTQLPNTLSPEEVKAKLAANPGGTFMVWKSGMAGWADPKTMNEFKPAPAPMPAPKAAVPRPAPAAPMAPIQPQAPAQAYAPAPVASGGGKAFFDNAASQLKQIHEGDSTHAFLPHLKWIDAILGWFGNKVPVDKLGSFDEFAKKWGNLGMLLSAVAILIFGICQGIKGSFGQAILMAIVQVLAVLIIQYVAIKFLDAGKSLIEKSPTHLSSRSFLDCLGLVVLLLIPTAIIGGIVAAIQGKSFIPVAIGLAAAVFLVYLLAVTMQPKTVNVTVAGDASAGQEAIAIISFFLKLSLRIVPLIFGVVNILAPFALLFFSVAMLIAEFPFGYIMQGQMAIMGVFWAALYPLVSYLIFLISYLFLDLVQSILEIPVKLEDLKKK